MIRTETHLKIILSLIGSDPKSRSAIAAEIGFSSPANIQGHLDYLERSQYIIQVSKG